MMKRIYCTKCNGNGYIGRVETWDYDDGTGGGHAWSESCEECSGNGFIEVPMTKADHIRRMSDEEIAKVLLNWFCEGNKEYYTRNRDEVYNKILNWLKSDV